MWDTPSAGRGNYLDPGQVNSGASGSFADYWGPQESDPQQAFKDALQSYLDWRARGIPGPPQMTDEGRLVTSPEDQQKLMDMVSGFGGGLGGTAGILKKVVHPDDVVALQSFRGTPEKLMGELRYVPPWKPGNPAESNDPWVKWTTKHIPEEFPAYFESLWADTPRSIVELWNGLKKELTHNQLDNMEISGMLPKAVPFWETVPKRLEKEGLPNLANRVRGQAQSMRTTDVIPEHTYGYNRGKGNPFEHYDEPSEHSLAEQIEMETLYRKGQAILDNMTEEARQRLQTIGESGEVRGRDWFNRQFRPTVPQQALEAFHMLFGIDH